MKKTFFLLFGLLTFGCTYGQDSNKNQPQLAAASTVENVNSDSVSSKTPIPAVSESIDPASLPASSGKPKDAKSPVLSEGDPKK